MTRNKRGIPEIRERLHELADQHGIPELHELADETYRQSPVRRAKSRSVHLTSAKAAKIRSYAITHPDAHQRDIAEQFDVNPGRVSEALNYLK